MKVIFHTGVHCTDDKRILGCLRRNARTWRPEGIAIPEIHIYRQFLSDAVNRIGAASPAQDVRDILIDAFLPDDAEPLDRLVLSHENFFCVPKLMFSGGRIYRKAEARLSTMARIFAQDEVELFLGLRDPASFLPAAFAATPTQNFTEFMCGLDAMQFRWSDLIRRLRADVPEVPITLWCNEYTPFIWGQVIREMAGIEMSRKIVGAFDIFASIIKPEGMRRFRAFLHANPNLSETQKRRVMVAFLDKYARAEAIEEELNLPGWDEALIDRLSAQYEEDIASISHIPGVRIIEPWDAA